MLQRRDTPFSCRDLKVNQTCHDEVDLTLCFQETAILYGICVTFWLLAGFEFITRRRRRPVTPFNPLNITRIVRIICSCKYTHTHMHAITNAHVLAHTHTHTLSFFPSQFSLLLYVTWPTPSMRESLTNPQLTTSTSQLFPLHCQW